MATDRRFRQKTASKVYGNTLYFSDVWFPERGVSAVVDEAVEAQRAGYRGIKLKLGRGFRWMEKEAGLLRDIEVVKAVRKATGPGMRIMVDPNDGYQGDRERAWRLMAETAESKLYWMEQIFPAAVEEYTWLKDKTGRHVRSRSRWRTIRSAHRLRSLSAARPLDGCSANRYPASRFSR